jgi:hypothetical protein
MFSSYGLVGLDFGDPKNVLSGAFPQALSGETNRYGDPRSTLPQAVARIGGLNIRGIHPEHDRAARLLKLKAEVEDARVEMRRQLSDRSLTPAQRARVQREQLEEVQRRMKKVQEFARETELPRQLR